MTDARHRTDEGAKPAAGAANDEDADWPSRCPPKGYGCRRVTAESRHRGMLVNSKKVRRIMCENRLSPNRKRRYIVTTDSNHDNPIYPNVARGFEVQALDQLWVGDITCVAVSSGFVYLAVILDDWSRKGRPSAMRSSETLVYT